ncbi:MAG: prephenate dehydratase [Candidatus Nanohaloarchaea archaeon]
MEVALLGPEGTYTHQAAEEYFDELEPVFCSTLKEVFESGHVKFVPFENSLGGGVSESADLLREHDVEVTGEQRLEINHALVSEEEELESIEKLRSHPQALEQSRKLIEEHGFEQVEASSTAGAAEEVKGEEGEAALASELAAEIYDLNILQREVQDNGNNVTRFLVLDGEEEEGEKTLMILEPGEDRPGLLSNMLSCFSGHGINLSYIQSRPTKQGLGDYYFLVEAEADSGEREFELSLKCLESYADVKVLGSYR